MHLAIIPDDEPLSQKYCTILSARHMACPRVVLEIMSHKGLTPSTVMSQRWKEYDPWTMMERVEIMESEQVVRVMMSSSLRTFTVVRAFVNRLLVVTPLLGMKGPARRG